MLSNLHRNYGLEFYVASYVVRCRNRAIECGSNPSFDRVPTVDDLARFCPSSVYFGDTPYLHEDQEVPKSRRGQFFLYPYGVGYILVYYHRKKYIYNYLHCYPIAILVHY